ncbi:hypothetical protein [Agarivorans sp. Alg241-V36]|uniref:hypothetical protein n=1 Tax=Agarivorans sp. Alg241-V36 TaxID=2305992 RepID=UPI0013D258D3|nr:hypothetical protein [Agarivorans sp. Alg241-V36]
MLLSQEQKDLSLAFLFTVLVFLVPWVELRGAGLADLANYIYRFNELKVYGSEFINPDNSLIGYFTSEAAWAYLLLLLSKTGIEAKTAMFAISFFCFLCISSFVFVRVNKLYAALLLVNPLLIDLVMAQQRSALALSLFLLAIPRANQHLKAMLFVMGVFTHAVFLFMSALYYLSKLLSQREREESSNQFYTLAVIVVVAAVFIFGKDVLLALLGDRRAGVSGKSVSFLYAAFWIVALFYVAAFHKEVPYYHTYMCLFFLTLFLFATLSGQYSSRYIALGYPFFIVTMGSFERNKSLVLFLGLLMYQYLQWIYWWGFLN